MRHSSNIFLASQGCWLGASNWLPILMNAETITEAIGIMMGHYSAMNHPVPDVLLADKGCSSTHVQAVLKSPEVVKDRAVGGLALSC